MRKTVVVFGLLSGAVSSALMLLTVPFMDRIGFSGGAVIGYTGIVASFLLVYFGIRSYRDQAATSRLTFGRAFAIGLLISLISCAFYVVTWEFVYYKLKPDFMDQYTAYAVTRARERGASEQEIDATKQRMAQFRQMYDNPAYNAALTFMEPFPIGVLVTAVSAAILRQKPQKL